MKKIVFITALFLLTALCSKLYAQTSTLKIGDVFPHFFNLNKTRIKKTKSVQISLRDTVLHDTTMMRLIFTCSSPDNTDTIVIKLGNSQDDGSTFYKKFPVVKNTQGLYGCYNSAVYFIQSNMITINWRDIMFNCFTNVTKIGFNICTNGNLFRNKWITIYAYDKQHNKSNTEYFKLQ